MNSEQQQSATIIRYFIEEAQEHLQTIEQGVLSLQEVLADVEGINELFRAAHSIKGGAAMLSFDSVQHISHRLEDYFKILKDHTGIVVDEKLKSLLLASCDRLQGLLNYLEENFTISQELATDTIAEAEPIFIELESHLNALVASMPGVDDTLFKEQLAESEVYNKLMVKFQEGVAEQLRDMLQLLRQDDNPTTRQQLHAVCDRLLQLGDNLTISGWRDLITTSKSAITNPANPYLTLAQVIIREIRQAQDLVLAEKSYEIDISEQLQTLAISPNISDVDVFAGDDLGLEDYTFTEDVTDSSDDFLNSFEGEFESDFVGSLDAEDPFSLQEEGEAGNLDPSDDFSFDLSDEAENLSTPTGREDSPDISLNWDDADLSSASSDDEFFAESAEEVDNVGEGKDIFSESVTPETNDLSFSSADSDSSDEYSLENIDTFLDEDDLETFETDDDAIAAATDSASEDIDPPPSYVDNFGVDRNEDEDLDDSLVESLRNEVDPAEDISSSVGEEVEEATAHVSDELTRDLDKELSAALALDEIVELEVLGFDLDDAEEEDNIIYQGLAAASQMLEPIDDSSLNLGEVSPAIAEEQVAEFFAEDDTSGQSNDTESQGGYADVLGESSIATSVSDDFVNESSLELPDFSTTEFAGLENNIDLDNDLDNDLEIDLDAPNPVDAFATNLQLDTSELAEDDIQFDSTSVSNDEMLNMSAVPEDIEDSSEISLDLEADDDTIGDVNIAETTQAFETPEFGDFSDLLAIGEDLESTSTEVNAETTRLEERTAIQEEDASVLDDLSVVDEAANDEVDLENLFADDGDETDRDLSLGDDYAEEIIVLDLELPELAEPSPTNLGGMEETADDIAGLSWLDTSEEMSVIADETASNPTQSQDPNRDIEQNVNPDDFGDLMGLGLDDNFQELSIAVNPQENLELRGDLPQISDSSNNNISIEGIEIPESVFVDDAEDLLGDTAGRVSELYKKMHQLEDEGEGHASLNSASEPDSASSEDVRENSASSVADSAVDMDFELKNPPHNEVSDRAEQASEQTLEQAWEPQNSDDFSVDFNAPELDMANELISDSNNEELGGSYDSGDWDFSSEDIPDVLDFNSSDAQASEGQDLSGDLSSFSSLIDRELSGNLETEVNNSEFSDLPAMLGDEDIANDLDAKANDPEFSDLALMLGDDESEISEIFGLTDDDFPNPDLDSDDRDGGTPKLKGDRPDPTSPNTSPSNDLNGSDETATRESSHEPSSDSWGNLSGAIEDTSSARLSNQAALISESSNLSAIAIDSSPPSGIADKPPHTVSSTSSESFDDLDALLATPVHSITASKLKPTVPPVSSLPFDSFDDLEALLSKPPQKLPAKPVSMAPAPKPKKAAVDEFDELESLLHDTYPKETTSASTKISKRQALAKRSVSKIVSQTMKVDVKHLDSLNNLVGELVVNRNLLAQDQEKLQQFIVNLLIKVQQLGDVAQRMRDQYDRSLMETSIKTSSPSAFSTEALSVRQISDGGSNGSALTATFEDIELDRYNSFHILSQEIIELVVRVRESASDIEFVVDETEQVSRQLGTITTQIQDDLKQVRMVPFAQIADRLPRAVRDLSFKTGKQAELEIHGRETLIDKAILEQLYDPMTHLVNNAIVHGLEDPNTRKAAGKSTSGKISIRAFHQGNQTVISISDDGAGINTEKVKQSAVKKGLYSQREVNELNDIQTYDLLFEAGFSTRLQADELAGRGVGLDVVRTTLNEIRGTVHTDSSIGKGTTFTIRLPLTLSISKAMFCVSDRVKIAFPVDGFEDIIEIPQSQVKLNDKGQPCIPWRDTVLPFQPLSNLLPYNRYVSRRGVYGRQDEDVLSVIILRNEGNYLALQVDQFLGENEIVIKQLEGPIPKPAGIAGATILGDGKVMAIASVLELFDIAAGRLRPTTSTVTIEPIEQDRGTLEPTVLIVDDSITVRELLSLTFAKVGYRVEQAKDGQDAWEKLRSGLPCNLIFCDIEMPRMDGLELLSRLQKDEHLSQIPIAMLTSRGADRYRQTAKELGAKGYFTKPYLEEEVLSGSQRMLQGEALL